MVIKNIQVPKNQYPNVIKKSYKDVYFLSLQEKMLKYYKTRPKNFVDEPLSQMISNKRFLVETKEIHSLTQIVKKTIYFSDLSYTLGTPVIMCFSTPKKAFKHLFSLSEIKTISALENYKEYNTESQHLVVREETDSQGYPYVIYSLYQIEKLPKNDFKNIIVPCCNNDIINEIPSVINQTMNWKPSSFYF